MHALTHKRQSGVVTRGGFLKVLGAAMLWPWMDRPTLFAAVDDLFSSGTGPAAPRFHLHEVNAALFRRELNTTFLVRSETGARVPLRLASVVEFPLTEHIEQFSLTFDAPDGATDLHGTRAFEHRTLGHFDVFIVPVGATTPRPLVYEACFSRFVSGGGRHV